MAPRGEPPRPIVMRMPERPRRRMSRGRSVATIVPRHRRAAGLVVLVLAGGGPPAPPAAGTTSTPGRTTAGAIGTGAQVGPQALPGDVHTKAAGRVKAAQLLTLVQLPKGAATARRAASPLLQYASAPPAADPAAVVDV